MFKVLHTPDMKIGFNSVGGFATVNHLHLQVLFREEPFPIEE